MNALSPVRCAHGCNSVKQGFKLVRRYGPHYTPLYEFLRCGQQFSGRYDSVFSGFHTDEQTKYSKFTGSTSRNIIYLAFSMDYGSRGKIMEFTRNIST